MNSSVISDLSGFFDLYGAMAFICGLLVFPALDSLIDFIIKKKRQIAEKRKKGE